MTFITWLAAFAMMTAVASMFVIISVFSGLEDLNRDMVKNLHADLTIRPKDGKLLKNLLSVEKSLKTEPEVAHYSKIIEEKVLMTYGDASEIAYLRAVDSAYTSVNPLHESVFYGKYPDYKYSNEAVMENGLNNRLQIPVDSTTYATLYMPKPGKGIILKEEDIFNKKEVFISGVFSGNDQLNNYLVAPLELGQQMLGLPKKSAYQIAIKLKNPTTANDIKESLNKKLGRNYTIKTKEEENSAFWKMINTEKMMIYLIFALVIFITTFNLAGAIIILQLDKKLQSRSLISLGFSLQSLRNTYFFTGVLIVLFGIIAGLIVGTILCIIQQQSGVFKATEALPFPVRIRTYNYILVTLTAAVFGLAVSWFFSKINKDNLLT